MAAENYYELLGLDSSASTDAVRNAYKEKAMKHHPDRGGDATTWESMQKAYDTLSDLQRRAVYDRTQADALGGAEKQFAQKFGEGAFDLTDGAARGRKAGMSILKQIEEVRKDEERMKQSNKTAVVQTGLEMTHSAGFEAWLRNREGTGTHGHFDAESLVREAKINGDFGIETTDSMNTPLPPMTATAVRFDAHGVPEEVLKIDKAYPLADQLESGEVLVYMLAACVNEDDLLRVQTPLTILNNFPPFNRTKLKWEEIQLPAVAGVEGVGIVIATAKDVPAPMDEDSPMAQLPGLKAREDHLEVKDWVVALPNTRRAPIGAWSTLCVCEASQLLKVPAQLLPLQHYACSRALCTAYRLLEDYGSLRPGDTIIQNASDLPTGQAVIQLCSMLNIRSINLVADDEGFERTKELLVQLGATHVLRDNSKLSEFLEALGSEMPRLALDALGGDAGKRLAIALRPGGSLVVHAMQYGQVPQLSPSVIMYQQVSLYGFSLSQWVGDNGREAYLQMLRTLAELVQAERLNVFTRTVKVGDLTPQSLVEALNSHRVAQNAKTFRERSVFLFGDEAAANDLYFEVAARIRKLEDGDFDEEEELAPIAATGEAAVTAAKSAAPRASERWADATAMLKELDMAVYIPQFEEEEMTSMLLLEDIVSRADGEKELMEALKEMGIKKMGHRQSIVGAIVGRI